MPGGKEEAGGKVLPSMPHTSGLQYISACNCGRTQANREDPFMLAEANYTFYQGLEVECCKDLEHAAFPEHSPVKTGLADIRIEPKEEKKDKEKDEKVEKDMVEGVVKRSTTPAQDDTSIILEVLEHLHLETPGAGQSPSKVALLLQQSRGLEALPHMQTLSSAPGLRPEFPSWALVCVGSSHLYSHSSGLGHQPGFLSAAKFLLPWEVPLTKQSPAALLARWPSIVENAAKKGRGEEEEDCLTVKVFLGWEYECPRGHRFMVSAPDRPMKSCSTMREAATRLISSDLPLYMACPCRLTRPPVAQLTRLHVVTPKAPIWVTVNPQVQPSPGGPVFVTGWETPQRLAINSYWVLRLPYVYCGEGGAHLPPSSPPTPEAPCGNLLAGAIALDQDWTET